MRYKDRQKVCTDRQRDIDRQKHVHRQTKTHADKKHIGRSETYRQYICTTTYIY